ncbi:general secretion pathway protein [Sphingomonas spermidinifaciens]|uniref:General secretion pathway protein n=1 Tax=Sphingomonas spermidinifaciens TaxID=1141889 RepID=A0A2A4B7D6_9SPHN|nr:AAA family ATPase [Sphingomonas spermidinifaciens]PCD03556.1 general secretion pathway protein [Sphingomonas spermidinifaciens]
MYDTHYGLTGRPFQLTPDPGFWFDTATHRKAMAYLGYGLAQGEGFIVITGDPGAGKTTLVGHLMGRIDRERLHVIQIVSTQVDAADLLGLVAAGLGIAASQPKAQLLGAIERGLHAVARGGKRTLLIVDEAQSLPVDSLEELRMLSNFQAGGYPLLQIFLLGQPEFRHVLHGAGSLEQLRQRVIAMHHLDPMGVEEVEAYLIHRLKVVGWDGRPSFDEGAIAALHVWSGGVPRRLNQLAARLMLHGAIEGIERFGARDVEVVTAELDADMAPPAPLPEPVVRPLDAAARPIRAEGPPPPPSQPLPTDSMLERRVAELEERLEAQDAALRRVLTLLVDWVENDARPDKTMLRGSAA